MSFSFLVLTVAKECTNLSFFRLGRLHGLPPRPLWVDRLAMPLWSGGLQVPMDTSGARVCNLAIVP